MLNIMPGNEYEDLSAFFLYRHKVTYTYRFSTSTQPDIHMKFGQMQNEFNLEKAVVSSQKTKSGSLERSRDRKFYLQANNSNVSFFRSK